MRSILQLALAFALPLLAAGTAGAEVKQLDPNATADDFVHALAPAPGTALKFRGIRVLNSNPASAGTATPASAPASDPGPAPAVAVDIKFGLNSAKLTDEARDVIKQIGTAMKSSQLASYHFLLEGHTDTTGRPDHNLTLSAQRAQAVRNDLIKTYGVEPARLEAKGRGQEALLDPTHPDSPVNRRVQIVNLGQQ